MANKIRAGQQSQKGPNIFIVGSMKCGTTILYDFLTAHPEIAGGTEKEVHYFSLYHNKGEDWYSQKFPPVRGARYRVDASPTYLDMCLTVPTAERIKDFNPDAKIIILIRNPIRRAISHFNHLKTINKRPDLETISFDDLIERNWAGGANAASLEGVRRMILDFSKYENKIKRFVDVFERDNVIVVANEDLRKHGDIVVRQIYDFIGLQAPDDVDFSQQKYLHGSDKVSINQKNYFSLLEELGDDYYRSCRQGDYLRPISNDDKIVLNQPIGAIVNEVGVGEDGWLFLATGSNQVLNMYTESEDEHLQVCASWHEIVLTRAKKVKSFGAKYYHMMVPEKMTLLGDKLHWPIDTGRSRGATFNNKAPLAIRENLIDLVAYMRSLKDREKYFHKTDSHWNFFGAFVAYQLLCSTLSFKIRNDLLSRKKNFGEVLMDLGAKLPDSPKERVFFSAVREDSTVVSDEGLVRYKLENNVPNAPGLHVGSFVQFENLSAPNPEKLLLFGDSFCEYRDHLLTGLLAESFQHVVFIWSSGLDYRAIETFRPDVVVCAMTERFMDRTVDDQFDYIKHSEQAIKGFISQ